MYFTGLKMSDDREPITPSEEKESKRDNRRDQNADETDARNDGEKKGKCSCNTAFFLSIEGALKIIEFVSIKGT